MPLSEHLEKAFLTMNEGQRQAVVHGTGPMLVLAGPGSGKTFVITNRIAYLIEHYGVPPEHILVITFTKEAALSMQQRFLAKQSGTCPVNFGTFHAIFYQILKQSAPGGAGSILTDSEKRQFMVPILIQLNQKLNPQKKDLSGNSEEVREDAVKCLAAISYYKNTFQKEKAACLLSEPYKEHFSEILAQYEQVRSEGRRLDFDDMLYSCRRLLVSSPEILQKWRDQFRYLLIDEFQDINPIQYDIIRLLAQPEQNLFAVGDDDQSIYGFRGSEPHLMKQFLEDYPESRQVLLNINYRSLPGIVNASLRVINENKDRFPKQLQAAGEEAGNCPVLLKGFSEREEQYKYLTEKLRGSPDLEECAVLFRTNAQMQGFASLLARERIPYSMKEKTACIYDHFIAKDINCYLQLAGGDMRRSLFLSVMNKPSRWISREALTKETVDFASIKEYYRKYAPPDRGRQVIGELQKMEGDLGRLRKYPPYLAVQFLRKGIGYERYLQQKAGTDQQRLSEWMETLDFLTMEAAGYQDYPRWLAMQQRVREEMEKNRSKQQPEKGVRLMTGHASKGLEFERVFIPDVNEGTYPHGHMPDDQTLEEERRIFYVAMTRAKKALELTYVTGTEERPKLPSRFLNPLLSIKSNPF